METDDYDTAVAELKAIHTDNSDISAENMISLAKRMPGVQVVSSYADDLTHHKTQTAYSEGQWTVEEIYDNRAYQVTIHSGSGQENFRAAGLEECKLTAFREFREREAISATIRAYLYEDEVKNGGTAEDEWATQNGTTWSKSDIRKGEDVRWSRTSLS